MKDDSIGSDDGSKSDSELYARLDTLAINGQKPEVGDKVQLMVDGTIKRIDDEVACIEPTAVNGQPMPEDKKEEDLESERKRLQAKAEQSDSHYVENEMPGASNV